MLAVIIESKSFGEHAREICRKKKLETGKQRSMSKFVLKCVHILTISIALVAVQSR